ncbi:hypothetical protein E1A91_D05G421400v1 [Gossypium mustelinum]|uniref:Uncharacterized protein n=2 Tax=Gossypium TaxID=3633 RepID=A0A5J5NDQ1_GOSBA|nr:hypothetical protein [Gossypium barbadense]KAB1671192.1 hypothetical protein [Gossypium barbadense]TYI85173.1 hypothetical protein E1A91_D05G421400v1 [Gossypium mustelinum]
MAGGRRHATEFPICAVEAYSEGLNFWKGSRGENKTFGPSRARIRRRQRTIAGQSKGRFRCQRHGRGCDRPTAVTGSRGSDRGAGYAAPRVFCCKHFAFSFGLGFLLLG